VRPHGCGKLAGAERAKRLRSCGSPRRVLVEPDFSGALSRGITQSGAAGGGDLCSYGHTSDGRALARHGRPPRADGGRAVAGDIPAPDQRARSVRPFAGLDLCLHGRLIVRCSRVARPASALRVPLACSLAASGTGPHWPHCRCTAAREITANHPRTCLHSAGLWIRSPPSSAAYAFCLGSLRRSGACTRRGLGTRTR